MSYVDLSCKVLFFSVAMWLVAACVEAQELWNSESPLPSASQLESVAGAEFQVIKAHEPDVDGYDWLHGVALAWHGDVLFATFGHNRGKENTATEVANYVLSRDDGRSWTKPKLIDAGGEPDLAVSHGVLLEADGQLWAFHGAFYGKLKNVHCRAYRYEDRTGDWIAEGTVLQGGFWPMQEPRRMSNGNWIMAGLVVRDGIGGPNNPAGVAISEGDDLLQWKLVVIDKQPELNLWGESTLIVDGPKLVNISRFSQSVALWSTSDDYGMHWQIMRPSNLAMAASKPYAGTLSNGRNYLIGNTTLDGGNRRWPLTIALTEPKRRQFVKVLSIRDAVSDGPGESHPKAGLAYPYAVERSGKLYVGYSNNGGRGANRNSAELAILPIASLE